MNRKFLHAWIRKEIFVSIDFVLHIKVSNGRNRQLISLYLFWYQGTSPYYFASPFLSRPWIIIPQFILRIFHLFLSLFFCHSSDFLTLLISFHSLMLTLLISFYFLMLTFLISFHSLIFILISSTALFGHITGLYDTTNGYQNNFSSDRRSLSPDSDAFSPMPKFASTSTSCSTAKRSGKSDDPFSDFDLDFLPPGQPLFLSSLHCIFSSSHRLFSSLHCIFPTARSAAIPLYFTLYIRFFK